MAAQRNQDGEPSARQGATIISAIDWQRAERVAVRAPCTVLG